MERIINFIQAYLWLAVAIMAAIALLFFGAYWHIPAGALAFLFYKSCREDAKNSNE